MSALFVDTSTHGETQAAAVASLNDKVATLESRIAEAVSARDLATQLAEISTQNCAEMRNRLLLAENEPDQTPDASVSENGENCQASNTSPTSSSSASDASSSLSSSASNTSPSLSEEPTPASHSFSDTGSLSEETKRVFRDVLTLQNDFAPDLLSSPSSWNVTSHGTRTSACSVSDRKLPACSPQPEQDESFTSHGDSKQLTCSSQHKERNSSHAVVSASNMRSEDAAATAHQVDDTESTPLSENSLVALAGAGVRSGFGKDFASKVRLNSLSSEVSQLRTILSLLKEGTLSELEELLDFLRFRCTDLAQRISKLSSQNSEKTEEVAAMVKIISTLKEDRAKTEQMFSEEKQAMNDSFDATLLSLKNEHKNVVDKMTDSFEARVSSLENEHKNDVNELESGFEARISSLENEHKSVVDELKSGFEVHISSLESEHKNVVDELASTLRARNLERANFEGQFTILVTERDDAKRCVLVLLSMYLARY